MTTHVQVNVQGINVDEGLADLLKMLWDAGIWTQYSCQGGPSPAMILFPTVTDGLRFVQETLAVTGTYGCYTGQLSMHIAGPIPGVPGPMRFCVEWPAAFTPVWISAWNGTPMSLDEVLDICGRLEASHCPVSAFAASEEAS